MFGYIVFGIRMVFWWLGNLMRKLGKAPEYVLFTLEGHYPELPQVGGNPLLRMYRPPKISLLELADQFRMVAEDPRVKGVVILLRPLDLPLAKLDVLRGMIYELRQAGKRVVTWSYTYDTGMYYLASSANEIFLLPGGMLAPLGLYRQYTYLGDALEKVGLKADFIQISPYKSAADTYTRKEMSAEVRLMANWLADATYEEILNAIANGRKIDNDNARILVDNTPSTDIKAIEIGAIDGLLGEDDLPEYLGLDGKPAKLIPWKAASKRILHRPLKRPGPYIALMGIEGLIVDGRSGKPPVDPPIPVPLVFDDRAGDISVCNTIRQIILDKRASGVIVYINSRGGSATASESMRNALEKLATQKPLVVVMGPVAASGGYWVSTPGKLILAQPNTVTGSIGVISGKIADSGIFEKLFVNQEAVSRGENIRIFEQEAPFTEEERKLVLEHNKRIYDLFLERVAESRDMTIEEIDSIGAGRVWMGRQAVENGLVDEIGGLDLAVAKVRELTGLGSRTPLRIYSAGKQYIPPVTAPVSMVKYGIESLKIVSGKALCLLPWVDKA
jgi:protease-4